jgi:diguanylate cyclase (GGDEF)-like protein/PAS domain S-box-containing protein
MLKHDPFDLCMSFSGSSNVPAAWLRTALDAVSEPVFVAEARSMAIVYQNRAARECFGYADAELPGISMTDISEAALEPICSVWQETEIGVGGSHAEREIVVAQRCRDGSSAHATWRLTRLDESDAVMVVVTGQTPPDFDPAGRRCVLESDAPSPPVSRCPQIEALLQQPLARDPLTQLPDRRLLLQRLQCALRLSQINPDYRFALVFLDLDQFKTVNDRWGHLAGDRALSDVAGRIADCVRPGDLVARVGGDEFAIFIDALREQDAVIGIAERIAARLEEPIEVAGKELVIRASLGIALSRSDHQRPEDLLAEADRAMYRAKQRGGGCHVIANWQSDAPKPR